MKTNQEKIAVMQAFEDGKKIELRRSNWIEWQPASIKGLPAWNWEDYDYRIAPESKLRPWKPEEVPVGAIMKGKHSTGCSLILGNGAIDNLGIAYVASGGLQRALYDVVCYNFVHSTDQGKTWLPCGVMEVEK